MTSKMHASTSPARGRVGAVQPKWTGRIDITGFGRDERGNRYVGLRIRRKLRARRVYLPIDNLNSASTFQRLNKLGAHIVTDTARRELIERVQSCNPSGNLVKVATRLGAHGRCFVLPREILVPSCDSERPKLVRAIDPYLEFNTRFRVAGSAKGWKKLMRITRKNSRMMLDLVIPFSMCYCAITPPRRGQLTRVHAGVSHD